MPPFRVLEHTSDVGFEAWGVTREELFANAALALTDIIADLNAIEPRQPMEVRAAGPDLPDLLVNWLSEILYLFDAEGWLFSSFEIMGLTEKSISAVARGEKFDRARHQAKLLVKAITYHQLAVDQTVEGWRARVYLDI